MFLHYVLERESSFGADKKHVRDEQTILFAQRPFVMNAEAEIAQAIKGYRNGRMGSIDF